MTPTHSKIIPTQGVTPIDLESFPPTLTHGCVSALCCLQAELRKARRLRILIVGFGNFGQFLGSQFVKGGTCSRVLSLRPAPRCPFSPPSLVIVSTTKEMTCGWTRHGRIISLVGSVPAGHTVIGSSRSDYTDVAAKLGCLYCSSVDDAIEAHDPQVRIPTNRAGTSPVNAVVRETITERQVHFQSSD